MATILVALDGSEAARSAVETVRRLAAPHSKLVLFTVMPSARAQGEAPGIERAGWRWPGRPESALPGTYPSEPPTRDVTAVIDRIREEIIDTLETVGAELRREGFQVTCDMAFGDDAVHEILAQAEHYQADAIAVATFGHTRVRQALIGSTSTKLIQAHRFPVLVAPAYHSGG